MRKVIEDSLTEEMMEINKDTMQKIKQILEDRLALDIDVKLDVRFSEFFFFFSDFKILKFTRTTKPGKIYFFSFFF